MLIISAQVMTAFEAEHRQIFVDRAIDHARRFDAAGFGALDRAAQRQFVLDTVALAEDFGFTGEDATLLLLESRCLLGADFPSGQEHEWARNLLASEWTDDLRTMTYVHDTAMAKARADGRIVRSTRPAHA